MATHGGSCHCGAISVRFHSEKPSSELGARTCQCSFCQQHGASWTSDPQGSAEVEIAGPVSRYQFGTKTADFFVCRTCGVVPVVVGEIEGKLLGVVRVNCLEDAKLFLEHTAPMDLDGELLEARLDRRAQRWTPVKLIEHKG